MSAGSSRAGSSREASSPRTVYHDGQASSPVLPHGAYSPSSSGLTNTTVYSPEVGRMSAKARGKQPVRDLPSPPSSKKVTPPPSGPPATSVFLNQTSDVTRYILIMRFPGGETFQDPNDYLKVFEEHMKLYESFEKSVPLNSGGDIRIHFDDVRDAEESYNILRACDYNVHFITQREFAYAKYQDSSSVNLYEGQMLLTIRVDPAITAEEYPGLYQILYRLSEPFGAIRLASFDRVHADTGYADCTFRVEYYSIDAATRAIHVLNEELPSGAFYGVVNAYRSYTWQVIGCRRFDPNPSNDDDSRPDKDQERGRYMPRGASSTNDRRNDKNNRVRRERIVDGTDVRTTVMLRNIPNKLDWMGLKALLDKFCFGMYDFFYLRIDFCTGCNVGYAFVNFSSIDGLVHMIDNIEHRTWSGFRSQKAAEISYATIQGKEALTEKFRNSSVMQEAQYCRPRIFFSHHEAINAQDVRLTGTEQMFPQANNIAKLQRSIDSARSAGLFPPNATTVIEQRLRPGIYDAGNPREAPAPVVTMMHADNLPQHVKDQIERLYNWSPDPNNAAYRFDAIPREFVQLFLQFMHPTTIPTAASQPGVISRPSRPTMPTQTVEDRYKAYKAETPDDIEGFTPF